MNNQRTPFRAYCFAVLAGLIIPTISLIPFYIAASIVGTRSDGLLFGWFLVGFLFIAPFSYYFTGYFLGNKWSGTSKFTWSFLATVPLIALLPITMLLIIPVLLFSYITFSGAKQGILRKAGIRLR